jgi:hypothetical protein
MRIALFVSCGTTARLMRQRLPGVVVDVPAGLMPGVCIALPNASAVSLASASTPRKVTMVSTNSLNDVPHARGYGLSRHTEYWTWVTPYDGTAQAMSDAVMTAILYARTHRLVLDVLQIWLGPVPSAAAADELAMVLRQLPMAPRFSAREVSLMLETDTFHSRS